MPSKREKVLAALHARLKAGLPATVRRNEVLPERVPAEGLVILRDGDPGEPDVTLNPRTQFTSIASRSRPFGPRQPTVAARRRLMISFRRFAAALAPDRSLGGEAENLTIATPEAGALAIEGAAPILTARLIVTVEYLVSGPSNGIGA